MDKMLNLITGQVTVRKEDLKYFNLSHMVTKLLHTSLLSQNTLSSMSDLNSSSDCYFELLNLISYTSTVARLQNTPLECTESLLVSYQKYMPHWTSSNPDTVVFATIDEAMSATSSDVARYLLKLKEELNIGNSGYPSKVVIGGDQQTFQIMKDLQETCPRTFDWMYVVHGDWHLMKLASEVLKDQLWDGSLKEMGYTCGYKSDLKGWQEIHLMLVAVYEALLRQACTQFLKSPTVLGI